MGRLTFGGPKAQIVRLRGASMQCLRGATEDCAPIAIASMSD
jgi:hypothetical protein